MDDDLKEILINIRAVITSSKGRLSLRELIRDYESEVGNPIPYLKYGHNSVESFLQSLPSVRVSGSGRDAVVEAASSQQSQHMASLIAFQKSKRSRSVPARRGGFSSRPYRGTRGSSHSRYYAPSYKPPPFSVPRGQHSSTSYAQPRYPIHKNDENEPLVIRVEGNKQRQVSKGSVSPPPLVPKPTTSEVEPRKPPKKYEVPPRLRKARLGANIVPDAFKEQFNEGKLDSDCPSDTIICPLGPSQLVAAGLANKQSESSINFAALSLQRKLDLANELETEKILHEKILDRLRQFPPQVPLPDNSNIHNNVSLLLRYANEMNWCVPDYVDMARYPKGSPIQCTATVKLVDVDKKFPSFPHEVSTKNLARGYAAKHALEWLKKEEEVKLQQRFVCTDNNLMFERVIEIVSGHLAGVFAKYVEEEYIQKFGEHLPLNWIETLKNGCPTLSVEPSLNSWIIVAIQPTQHINLPVLQQECKPPELDLPLLEEHWSVFVTYAYATDNVWFRLIGENYSDLYGELLAAMEEYYIENRLNELALRIVAGHYYAAQVDDSVLRVCVEEVHEESQTVSVFFVDHGDVDTLPFASIYRLLPEFCEIPKQAIRCILDGLEHLNQNNLAMELVCTSLFGQTLIAEITHRDQETGCVKAVLHDTSKSDDLNMNEKLLAVILSEKIGPVPLTFQDGLEMEVYAGNVSKVGEVYIQIPGPEFNWITQILEILGTEEISKHKLKSFRQLTQNKIYLAKYSGDHSFYRAIVKTASTNCYKENKIAVQFIDFGNEDTVSISDIAAPDNLSPILSKLPAQAIKVALHNLPIDTLTIPDIVKLQSLVMDEEKNLIIKIMNSQENPPTVEIFYKGDSETNGLISINNTIAQAKMILNKTRAEENESRVLHNDNGCALKGLQQPKLNEDFEPVVVVLAANPTNFIFQPYNHLTDLDILMKELKEFYDAAALPELPREEIVKGNVYAGYYSDEAWYRVEVTGEIMNAIVPIRVCDYGDMSFLSISTLRHLKPEFYKLPFMAVKGKLAGVSPTHTDWSVEDCMRFQELVLNKVLASSIIKIDNNDPNPMEMVVSLNLTDTNTEKDVVIARVLIGENRAVRTNS